MFKSLSKNQKNALLLCGILIAFAVLAGVVTRMSYSTVSLNNEVYSNAKLDFTPQHAEEYDEKIMNYDLDIAKREYDLNCEYIFKIKILSVEYCYGCTKYNAQVLKTVKGNIDETGKSIVIYRAEWFYDDREHSLVYSEFDYSFPLKPDKTYLVFVNKKDYIEEYQGTLDCNEYYLEPFIYHPAIYALDNIQKNFVDLDNDKTLANVEDQHYICFSQEALDHINRFAQEVIDYYDQ